MRAGLSCQQALLARADPAGPLGRRRRLHRQDHVDRGPGGPGGPGGPVRPALAPAGPAGPGGPGGPCGPCGPSKQPAIDKPSTSTTTATEKRIAIFPLPGRYSRQKSLSDPTPVARRIDFAMPTPVSDPAPASKAPLVTSCSVAASVTDAPHLQTKAVRRRKLYFGACHGHNDDPHADHVGETIKGERVKWVVRQS